MIQSLLTALVPIAISGPVAIAASTAMPQAVHNSGADRAHAVSAKSAKESGTGMVSLQFTSNQHKNDPIVTLQTYSSINIAADIASLFGSYPDPAFAIMTVSWFLPERNGR